MCGIAGKVSWTSTPSVEVVKKMTDALAHRGPDDHGIVGLENAALGHRRLSIIDLSDRARQPMQSADGRYHIVYNGELYNFKELKKDLIDDGVEFRTTSDTEVFLYSYIKHGKDCLKTFNGMFAAAIWDDQDKTLFLARDRFGKKPLYYCIHSDKSLSFASEVRAFKADPEIRLEYSAEALNCYLALGYILAPMSCYKDVFKLTPASYMQVSEGGAKIESGYYWDYAEHFLEKTKDKTGDIQKTLIDLLLKSVEKRMVADVPVGAFLSGGIDSSSIVACIKSLHKVPLHTFSMGFNLDSYNELRDAEKTAVYFGTEHHSKICDASDGTALLRDALLSYDEPFADTSLVPTYEVSEIASGQVKVVLSGDGADELFAGYVTYKADYFRRFSWIVPSWIKKNLAEIGGDFSEQKLSWRYKLKQFAYGAQFSPEKAHYSWRLYLRPEERVKILGEKLRDMVYDTDPFNIFQKYYKRAEGFEWLDKFLYVDGMTWLPDDILYKVDRASMRHGLEVRCPYLDHELAAYAASIPSHLKLNGLKTKYILKKSLAGLLPDFVIKKRKSGFNAPVGKWIGAEGLDEHKAFNQYVFQKKVLNVAI